MNENVPEQVIFNLRTMYDKIFFLKKERKSQKKEGKNSKKQRIIKLSIQKGITLIRFQ